MKKKRILIILFLIDTLLIFFLLFTDTSWRTTRGSDSKEIINGYRLISISAYDKSIGYELEDGSTKIGTYVQGHVYKYCYNSRYIGIQQIKPAKRKSEFNYTQINYYIIDTDTDTIFPFTSREAFDEFIITNKINGLSNWIETVTYE